jgi:hypothetical protein
VGFTPRGVPTPHERHRDDVTARHLDPTQRHLERHDRSVLSHTADTAPVSHQPGLAVLDEVSEVFGMKSMGIARK